MSETIAETELQLKKKKKKTILIKEIDDYITIVTTRDSVEETEDKIEVEIPKETAMFFFRPKNIEDQEKCIVSVVDFATTLFDFEDALKSNDEAKIKEIENKLSLLSQEMVGFCKSDRLGELMIRLSKVSSEEELDSVLGDFVG